MQTQSVTGRPPAGTIKTDAVKKSEVRRANQTETRLRGQEGRDIGMEKLSLSGSSKHDTDETMRGLSVVFVDGEDIFIDNGGIHGKSRIERGIRFAKSVDEVPNPRHVFGIWITLHRFQGGVQGYHGAVPFELQIDADASVGYKSLAQQVNGMERAIKGTVDISALPGEVKQRLAEFLKSVGAQLWEHAEASFREAFD